MRRFIIFAAVGGFGLLVNLAVTYLFTEYAHWWYLFSFTLGTLVSWTVAFLANSLVTFAGHSKDAYLRRYLVFLAGYTVIFACNTALVYTLTSILSVYYLVSISTVTLLSATATFFFSKRYVYRSSMELADDIGGSETVERKKIS